MGEEYWRLSSKVSGRGRGRGVFWWEGADWVIMIGY